MADSDIVVSLHLVITFISMVQSELIVTNTIACCIIVTITAQKGFAVSAKAK